MKIENPKIENPSAEKEPHLTGKRETTIEEIQELNKAVEEMYKKDGVHKDLMKLFMIHNNQVFYLVRQIAKAEGFNERELEIAEIAAILHDIKKGGEFEMHGELGGQEAKRILLKMGKSEGLAESVRLAIVRHMGNDGFVGEQARKKFGENFRYEEPKTRVGQSLYDADMLTIMTPEGIDKLLKLRETVPELVRQDEETSRNSNGKITVEDAKFNTIRNSILNTAHSIKLKHSKEIAKDLLNYIKNKYSQLKLDAVEINP